MRVAVWDNPQIRSISFAEGDVTSVLRAAADWIAEAYEPPQSIYGVVSVNLHETDDGYVLMVAYE